MDARCEVRFWNIRQGLAWPHLLLRYTGCFCHPTLGTLGSKRGGSHRAPLVLGKRPGRSICEARPRPPIFGGSGAGPVSTPRVLVLGAVSTPPLPRLSDPAPASRNAGLPPRGGGTARQPDGLGEWKHRVGVLQQEQAAMVSQIRHGSEQNGTEFWRLP